MFLLGLVLGLGLGLTSPAMGRLGALGTIVRVRARVRFRVRVRVRVTCSGRLGALGDS